MKRKYRVCVFPAGFSGCSWWRIRNPLEMARKKHPDMEFVLLNTDSMTRDDIYRTPLESDLIVMQAPGSPIAAEMIDYYKLKGKKIVVDYDDYSFDLSPFNPRYKELGIREVVAEGRDGKKWVWKDGYNGFNIKENLVRYNSFKSCCGMSDLLTTTTDYLGNKFRNYTANVHVLPNSIDFTKWVQYERPAGMKDQIRVGWFGGDSHYKDIDEIHESFGAVARRYRELKFVLFTPQEWPQLFGDIPGEQVEYHYWAQLNIYPLIISTMFWDIGLAPIEINEFSKCKSNIKWLEYSAVGAASICTNSIPYSTDIINGHNGLLADNNKFYDALNELCRDTDYRKFLAKNAFNFTKENYDLSKNCTLWYDCYRSILEDSSCVKKFLKPLQKLVNRLV